MQKRFRGKKKNVLWYSSIVVLMLRLGLAACKQDKGDSVQRKGESFCHAERNVTASFTLQPIGPIGHVVHRSHCSYHGRHDRSFSPLSFLLRCTDRALFSSPFLSFPLFSSLLLSCTPLYSTLLLLRFHF